MAEKPMLHEEDCEAGDDKNIPAFGICQSEKNPSNKNLAEKIARNGTDGSSAGDNLATLTIGSFLVCSYGGIIEPESSGQEEE